MKYYSQVTNKLYDTVEDLKKAEEVASANELKKKLDAEQRKNEAQQKRAEREDLKNKLDAAWKKSEDAKKEYYTLLEEYTKKFSEVANTKDDFAKFLEYLFRL